jgi:hypothetical protein
MDYGDDDVPTRLERWRGPVEPRDDLRAAAAPPCDRGNEQPDPGG